MTSDCEVKTKQAELQGCKIPLLKLRMLTSQKKYMHEDNDTDIQSPTTPTTYSRHRTGSLTALISNSTTNENPGMTTLQSYSRGILFAVWIVYDPAVFNEEEM